MLSLKSLPSNKERNVYKCGSSRACCARASNACRIFRSETTHVRKRYDCFVVHEDTSKLHRFYTDSTAHTPYYKRTNWPCRFCLYRDNSLFRVAIVGRVKVFNLNLVTSKFTQYMYVEIISCLQLITGKLERTSHSRVYKAANEFTFYLRIKLGILEQMICW